MPVIQNTPADNKEELLWEKELLGLNVSEDPVAKSLEGINLVGVTELGDITDEHIGKSLTFVGLLSGVRRITTKKGDAMLVGVLEDMTSTIEIVVFPKILAKCGDLLQNDAVLKMTAKVDNRRDSPQLVVDAVEAVEPSLAPAAIETEMDLEGVGDLVEREAGRQEGREAEVETQMAAPTNIAPSPAPRAASPEPPAPRTPPPPPAAPVSVIQSRGQVKLSSGGGNGGGKPAAKGAPTPATAETSSAPAFNGRTLRLYLPRSEDHEGDIRRMQDVHTILLSSSGGDQVTLYVPNGVGIVVLRSQHMVSCTSGLLDGLREVLGPERVALEG
jgi:DNA polymerase-3 subunit alpha